MKITPSVPLSKYTTFRTGGQARFFVEAESIEEIKNAVEKARSERLPFVFLGEGSNVLISDDGFPGYVIRPMIRGVTLESDGLVVAGAGEHWDDVVALTVAKNLSGLENMSWVPGSVGAAPVQNIGAYGSELKSVLEWIEVFDPNTNSTKILSSAECRFGYRDSLFKTAEGRKLVITRVAMRLKLNGQPNISYKDLTKFFAEKKTSPTIAEVREAVISIRKAKLPSVEKFGTVGSFFKNPIIPDSKYAELAEKFPGLPSFSADPGFKKIPLAWILDKVCGLNGYREGDVGLYETQPIAVVNFGQATTKDIKNFADKIAKIVNEKTGLKIEWEVNEI